jgi:signal transduction histidine kinase
MLSSATRRNQVGPTADGDVLGDDRLVSSSVRMASDERLLDLLHRITTIVDAARDVDDVFDQTIESICGRLGWSVAVVHVLEDGQLVARSSWQQNDDDDARRFRRACEEVRGEPARSLVGAPVAERTIIYLPEVDDDARFAAEWGDGTGVRRWIGCPIRTRRDIVGVVTLAANGPIAVPRQLLTVLNDIGLLLGHVIERERLVHRSEELDAAQALFISRAAHELRGPLATLGVAATTLVERRDRLTMAQQDQLLNEVERNTARLRDVFVHLFELNELESRQRPLAIERVAVAPQAEATVSALSASTPQTTSVRLEAGDSVVLADALAVDQIFSTLLGNALCHGGPHVSVTTAERPGVVRIVVEDDGPGLPPEVLATLFQPFSRGRDADRAGFGLSLTLSRQLARACGGDIVHERRAPKGTRFVLTLPGG